MKHFAHKTKAKAKTKLEIFFQPQAALNTAILTLEILNQAAESIPAPGLTAAIGGLLSICLIIQVL
jgi:hypothetical protein